MYQHTAVFIKYFTDMPNRAVFKEKLNYILDHRKGQTYKAAVFFVCIDNFADLNYAYGYKFGDDVLINIGKFLNTMFYGNEFISHYDGDCIALFLPDIRDADNAIYLAKKIIKAFHMP
jgi:diguanylate cyclase (GGDEF)-like protein